MKSGWNKAIVALLLASVWGISTTALGKGLVGELSGDAQNNMGVLSYKLPLGLPAGVKGTTPEIGLRYSSGSGSGFSLYGVSVISRCQANVDLDGFSGAVRFDGNDRYCLDGARLKETSGGLYSPVIKDFSKISRSGSKANPTSWEVRTRDGVILRYGSDNESRDNTAKGTYRWYLRSKADRFGNTINYRYRNLDGVRVLDRIDYSVHSVKFVYQPRGTRLAKYEQGRTYYDNNLLTAIEITTNRDLKRRYIFEYKTSGIGNIQQLAQVQLCDGNNNCIEPTQFKWFEPDNLNPVLRQEKLIHTNNRFLGYQMVDVTGEGQAEACYYDFSDATITCGERKSSVKQDTSTPVMIGRFGGYIGITKDSVSTLRFVDVNHDGYRDYCFTSIVKAKRTLDIGAYGDGEYVTTIPPGGTYCGLNHGNGTFASFTQWSSFKIVRASDNETDTDTEPMVRFHDVNTDRYPDLCVQTTSRLQCYLNTKSGKFSTSVYGGTQPTSTISTTSTTPKPLSLATSSLTLSSPFSTTSSSNNASIQKNLSGYPMNFPMPSMSFFVDMNGDGASDVCGFAPDGFVCYLNETSGGGVMQFSDQKVWSGADHFTIGSSTRESAANPFVIAKTIQGKPVRNSLRLTDFNNDGLTDACFLQDNHVRCAINDGQKFAQTLQITQTAITNDAGWGPEPTNDQKTAFAMIDINQDGRVDACANYQSGGYYCAFNNGNGKLGAMREYAQWTSDPAEFELRGVGKIKGGDGPITFADVNADSKIDVCYRSGQGISCAISDSVAGENLLKAVVTPYKRSDFSYGVLVDSFKLHALASEKKPGMLNIAPSLVALATLTTDNAAGSRNQLHYHYSGLRYDLDKGMRAFETVTKLNTANGQHTKTHYHQDGVLNGRVKSSTTSINGKTIATANYHYQTIKEGKIPLTYYVRGIDIIYFCHIVSIVQNISIFPPP
jgi:hypothetical protein